MRGKKFKIMQDMMLKRENPQALTTGDNSAIIMTKKIISKC